jgi:heme exporter protein D
MNLAAYFAAYFAMGGYAVFIWPSYALAVVLLAAVFLMAARRLKAAEQGLDHDRAEPGEGREP